jgi:mono/diheme cytochrome c family protein
MNGKLTRAGQRLALLSVVTVLGACSWFTDFKEQPKVDPWESPNDTIPMRGNPQNSVSVYGSAAPGYAVSRIALPGTIDSMAGIPNPVPADARSLHNGRMYYQINCAVCHGEAGKGDGPILATKAIFPPALVGAAAEARSDGYIWGIIRNGRGAMPSYNRIEELDRWDVVNYVRGLQGRYQVVAAPVGLPGETGDKVPGYSQMGPTRPSPYWHRAGAQAGPTRGGVQAPGTAPSESPVKSPTDSAHAPAVADTGRARTLAAPAATPAATPTMTHNPGGAR